VKHDLKTLTILFRATHSFEKWIKEDVQKYGLNTSEFGVLEVLYHKGPLSIQDIKEKVLIASSSMTYVVDQLTRKKVILRKQDISDKRVFKLELSQKGKEFMNAVYPIHAQNLRKYLDRLTPSEEETLRCLLKLIGMQHDQ
jgi:MarR family 2-MHQ and catechol resistance regulon transcriptional repressor